MEVAHLGPRARSHVERVRMLRCSGNRRWFIAVGAFSVLLGCRKRQRGGNRLPCVPARGKVEFRGPKAQEALVIFHPIGADVARSAGKPFGRIAEDGSFVVNTYETGDGLPAGQYAVTVIWRIPGPDEEPGRDVLAGTKYSSPATSPLKVSIDGKPAEFLFRLE